MQEEKINGRRTRERTEGTEAGERRARWLRRGRRALCELLWGSGAWLIGQAQLLLSTYPLGVALLCGTGKHTVAILAGLLLSCASMGELSSIYVCAYLAAALVRVLSGMLLDSEDVSFSLPEELSRRLSRGESADEGAAGRGLGQRLREALGGARVRLLFREVRHVFSESVLLRMGTAGVAVLLVALYRIIVGGFRYYDLFAAIFSVTVAVSATAVFSVALEDRCTSRILRRISEAALLFCAVYAASGLALFSLPLAPLLSLTLTLCVSYSRSGAEGIVTGVICGLASAPIMAPAYLLCALVYLFFHSMEKETPALLLSGGAAVAWIAYVGGVAALLWAIPTALLSGALFTLYCNLSGETETAAEETEAGTRETADVRYMDANERLRDVSEAFSSLSEILYNLSDRLRRPGALDLRRVCDGAFDRVCADCPNRSVCWGLEYSETLATVNGVISALHTRGRVTVEELGEELRARCARAETLVAHVNRECARVTGEMLRNNRTEIFAMDYESAAQIINEALLCEEEEYRADTALERRVAVYLADAGVETSGVSVFGKRCRRILIRGADVEHARVTAQTLRSDLGEMCDAALSPPVLSVENGVSSMTFRARQRLSVTVAKKIVSADGGVSGDSVNLFGNKREYFYALISDGMGAGRDAHLASTLCSVFLERMLRAGNRASTSLRMLHNMLRSRVSDSREECSSTVDLLELDLMTGGCTFFKSGAAPSFVIRGGVVRRMQSGSAPIGILCALDSRETSFELQAGDTVVMISDGILDAEGESDALISLLVETPTRTPEELVERICQDATARGEHDDCSAVAIRIEAYAEE